MKAIYDKQNKAVYHHFENVAQWSEYGLDTYNTSSLNDDSGFTDYTTGKQLNNMLVNCKAPAKARKAVSEALAVSADTHEAGAPVYTLYNDMSGIICDITAHTMGEYECMLNYDIQEQARPTIWIACSFGALSNAKEYQFFNRGIALIRAVKDLQSKGNSVGIIAYSSCEHEEYSGKMGARVDTHTQTVVVKRPQDELNESTMINMFTLPATLRTLGFCVRYNDLGSEYGRTITLPRKALAHTDFAHEKIVILESDGQLYNFKTADKGAQYIQKQIENTKAN